MGFSTLFIFALLQISLLLSTVDSTGVNSTTEDLSNIHSNDSSNHRHGRSLSRDYRIRAKKEDQSILDSTTYLELSNDSVSISIENESYYICISRTCDDVKIKVKEQKSSDTPAIDDKKCRFLVNKDNFEILEWNTWGDVHNGQIPVKPVLICKKFYITKEKQGFVSMIKWRFKKTDINTEILTLNNDIKSEYLEIDQYDTNKEKLFITSQVTKFFKAENRDCKSAKHVMKLDQGRDRVIALLKGQTITSGKAKEFSVTGKIPKLEIGLGGKYSVKYDESRLTSETISKFDKVLHSVSMEIEVPSNHSCSVDISSETILFQVPYSGQLIREYGDDEERTTTVTDMYDYQEVVDLLTFVNPCTPLINGTKC